MIEKMRSDPDWEISEQSSDLLLIINVIEKHVIFQTEYIYPFASMYDNVRIGTDTVYLPPE